MEYDKNKNVNEAIPIEEVFYYLGGIVTFYVSWSASAYAVDRHEAFAMDEIGRETQYPF